MSKIPNWILLPLLGVLFLAFWPLIFIFSGVKILWNEKSTDREKIIGAKLALVSLLGVFMLVIYLKYEYILDEFLSNFNLVNLFFYVMGGLLLLVGIQKLFPNWKTIKKRGDPIN